jgi:putative flippase GtrA
MSAGGLTEKEIPGFPFIRFVLVGLLNTAVGYGLFALFILLSAPSALALLVATVLGVLFNYLSTGRIVFAWRDSRRLGRFVLVYGVLYIVNAAALLALENLGFPALGAQAMLLPLFVVLAYLGNKHFVFRALGTASQ